MNRDKTGATLEQALKQAQEELCFPGSDDHVVKVELTRKGTMQVELALKNERRWFAWSVSGYRELKPGKDRKLPLSARLADKHFAWQTKVLAYRPGKRLTLRHQSGNKAQIIKGFRNGYLESMAKKYEVAQQAFTGRGVHSPEIIGQDSAEESLIMACLDGEHLTLSPETTDLFQLAGEALRTFQDYHAMKEEPPFNSTEELGVIDDRAKRLCQAGAALPPRWQQVRQRLDSTWQLLPAPVYGLAHRDLHDLQFIQQRNRLALLDFDLMTRADTALDPGNFLAHLVLRQMQGLRGASQRSIDVCGKKFLRGLDRAEEPGFWRRLRFYQATTFARLSLVYLVRPRWVHLVDDLLTLSGRCLDDFDRINEA